MKISERLENLQIGDIVNDKTILSALKRKGLIYDYSQWGYLESNRIKVFREEYGYCETRYEELFPNGNAKTIADNRFNSIEEFFDTLGKNEIEYTADNGLTYVMREKYLDGCFQPYLQLDKVKLGNGDVYTAKSVNPRMSVWGAII